MEPTTKSRKRFPCEHCSEVCSSNYNLERHVARRHLDRLPEVLRKKRSSSNVPLSFVLPSSIGSFQPRPRNELEKPKDMHEAMPYTSGETEVAEVTFSPTVAKPRKYACMSCMIVFGSKFNLDRHRRRRHGNEEFLERAVQMDPDEEVLFKGDDCIIDDGISQSRKRFPCIYCTEVCSSRFNLNRHIGRIHPNSELDEGDKKTIYCYLCSFSTCRLMQLSKHIEQTHNLQMNLMKSLRARFSATLSRRSHDENQGEDTWSLRCNHSTDINVEGTSRRPRRSPCTFYLNIRRIGIDYIITGCGSHFGHEVLDHDLSDVDHTISHERYMYGVNPEDDLSIGRVTYMHETQDSSSEANIMEIVNNMVNGYEPSEDKLVVHFTQSVDGDPSCSVQQSVGEADNYVLTHSPTPFLMKPEIPPLPFPQEVLEEEQGSDQQVTLQSDKDDSWARYKDRSPPSRPMAFSKASLEYVNKLCHLERLDQNRFRSNFLVSPTGRGGNAYGGLLFAQSLQAATHTVDTEKFSAHAIHSFFILNVSVLKPVDYKIDCVRDGRSYCTRTVVAEQEGKAVFTSQKEPTSIQHQTPMPRVPMPEELVDNVDFCRSYLEKNEKGEVTLSRVAQTDMQHRVDGAEDNVFEFRACDPKKYFALEKFGVEPLCVWIRCSVPLNDDRELHRFLVAYITDATLVNVANKPHISNGYVPSMLFSLDHTVRFHEDDFRADEWLLYENWSPWSRNGRAFSEGRLWTRDGRLILSAAQESLSRTRDGKSSL